MSLRKVCQSIRESLRPKNYYSLYASKLVEETEMHQIQLNRPHQKILACVHNPELRKWVEEHHGNIHPSVIKLASQIASGKINPKTHNEALPHLDQINSSLLGNEEKGTGPAMLPENFPWNVTKGSARKYADVLQKGKAHWGHYHEYAMKKQGQGDNPITAALHITAQRVQAAGGKGTGLAGLTTVDSANRPVQAKVNPVNFAISTEDNPTEDNPTEDNPTG